MVTPSWRAVSANVPKWLTKDITIVVIENDATLLIPLMMTWCKASEVPSLDPRARGITEQKMLTKGFHAEK